MACPSSARALARSSVGGAAAAGTAAGGGAGAEGRDSTWTGAVEGVGFSVAPVTASGAAVGASGLDRAPDAMAGDGVEDSAGVAVAGVTGVAAVGGAATQLQKEAQANRQAASGAIRNLVTTTSVERVLDHLLLDVDGIFQTVDGARPRPSRLDEAPGVGQLR